MEHLRIRAVVAASMTAQQLLTRCPFCLSHCLPGPMPSWLPLQGLVEKHTKEYIEHCWTPLVSLLQVCWALLVLLLQLAGHPWCRCCRYAGHCWGGC